MPISKVSATHGKRRVASVLSTTAILAVSGGFATVGTAIGSESPASAATTGTALEASSASCPGGVVTVQEEDYYGAATKQPTAGTGFQNYFDNYQKTNPCIKVVREAPATNGQDSVYLTHVLSQFSSGSEPNLLMLDNPELAEFAADNVLIPLSSLGTLSVVSKLNPANVAETTYNGKLYALPLYTNTEAIFYNKTLLAQNGITTLPTTWAQFGADAKKTAHGSDLGFVFSGQAGPGEVMGSLEPFSWTNGGAMSTPGSTGSVQAVSFLASLVNDGAAPKSVVEWSLAQPIEEFEAGKAAFAEEGLWDIPSLQQDYKNLNWGVMEIPPRVAGQTVIVEFGGEVWSIPKTNPTEEKAAFEVLKSMSSNIVALSRLETSVPTVTADWGLAPWNESGYAPFLAELRHGRSRTLGLKIPANEPAIELDTGEQVEAALIGKETPAEAMQAAQKQVNPLLK